MEAHPGGEGVRPRGAYAEIVPEGSTALVGLERPHLPKLPVVEGATSWQKHPTTSPRMHPLNPGRESVCLAEALRVVPPQRDLPDQVAGC